jgi:2,4-dienoyl-CoA reductase-like NADH-dependent reductase (Old Yellow Enzyme family)
MHRAGVGQEFQDQRDVAVSHGRLFEGLQIGRDLRLKSRVILAPLYYEWEFGSRAFMKFFESRAKGGVALAMVPVPTHGGLGDLEKASFAQRSRAFIEMMHGHGCKVVPQLFSGNGEQANDLSYEQLSVLPGEFARAARTLDALGYDGIGIHGAHHSLFMSLVSPLINGRTDDFGGSEENRFRLPLATVRAMRHAAGHLPIFYRFSAVDFVAGGFEIEAAIRLAMQLESAGTTCIDVSAGGTVVSPQYSDAPQDAAGEACFARFAAAIKQRVRVPVIVAGRINSRETAEDIIRNGMADAVAIGRLLVRNAQWPNEAAAEAGIVA